MDDLARQIEELEALTSIYNDDWKTDDATGRSYSMEIKENERSVLLRVTLPVDYPSKSPPNFEFSAPWMDRHAKEDLQKDILQIYFDTPGETVIFQWIERVRDELQIIQKHNEKNKSKLDKKVTEDISDQNLEETCPEINHGEPIQDRKSIFQGHAAIVHTVEDVKAVLRKLKTNKKILNATHNMYAYRIERKSATGSSILQDCDDDGESHAGSRMLHLLQILDQKNALVVVSRWYGGIQLGPDRFRHINNATRQVLVQAGLVKS